MEQELQDLTDKIIKYADRSGVQYCDARAEQQVKKSILIENEEIEHVRNNEDKGIGIRLITNGSWSFCSITNPNSFEEIKDILDNTIKNSDYTFSNKKIKLIYTIIQLIKNKLIFQF
jgi:Predicted Zn-dependent proteases and their inactivated homologs